MRHRLGMSGLRRLGAVLEAEQMAHRGYGSSGRTRRRFHPRL